MGQYATLSILHKLYSDPHDTFYRLFHLEQQLKQGKKIDMDKFLNEEGITADELGIPIFHKINGNIYFEYIPSSLETIDSERKECKLCLKNEWLVAFKYPEMNFNEQTGQFKAVAMAGNAYNRLKQISNRNNNEPELLKEIIEVQNFITKNSNLKQDLLLLSSNDIFKDGNIQNAKGQINQKIKDILNLVRVPYWTTK